MRESIFISGLFTLLLSFSLAAQTNKFTRPYQPPTQKSTPNLVPLKPLPFINVDQSHKPETPDPKRILRFQSERFTSEKEWVFNLD